MIEGHNGILTPIRYRGPVISATLEFNGQSRTLTIKTSEGESSGFEEPRPLANGRLRYDYIGFEPESRMRARVHYSNGNYLFSPTGIILTYNLDNNRESLFLPPIVTGSGTLDLRTQPKNPDLERRMWSLAEGEDVRKVIEKTGITDAELRVLLSISNGLTAKDIALKMANSPHTVSTHKKNLFRKLGVNNTPQANAWAQHAGIMVQKNVYDNFFDED